MLSTETPPALTGDIVTPDHAEWDIARRGWNLAVDQRPALVAFPADAADVQSLIEYAIRTGMKVAPQGTGHNAAALGALDDTILLSTQRMRGVEIDPEARTARVQAGTLWLEVTEAATPHGLFPLSGSSPDVGVVGYTLGGGLIWLARRHGLAANAVTAIELVTPDAQLVRATADVHPDLFWALRGGGGNFGVVTALEFRLHPLQEIYGGPMFFELDDARAVLDWYRGFIADAPEEFGGFPAYQIAPPLPFIPEERHGDTFLAFVACWAGPIEQGESMLKPIHDVAPVVAEHVGAMPYAALNSAFDALVPPGLQHYWKANFVTELTDDIIDAHLRHGPDVPVVNSTMHIYPIDGAVHRVGATETAFAHREANFATVIAGMWPDPAQNEANIAWVRDYYDATAPLSEEGGYINFMAGDDQGRIRANYGPNYDRLVEVKRRYDPDNLFHLNQNIAP